MITDRTIVLTTERKLAIAAVGIACVTASLAFVGGLSNFQYYLTVDECRADAPSLVGKRLRVSGTIAPSSLRVREGRRSASFVLQGSGTGLDVDCAGPLPDNLAEGIQVVVEGRLRAPEMLQGERVLTRCASKYRSQGPGAYPATPADGHGSAR